MADEKKEISMLNAEIRHLKRLVADLEKSNNLFREINAELNFLNESRREYLGFEQNVKIKVNYHGTEEIKEIPQGDWIDLKASEMVVFEKGEYKKIPLGVSMELPEGYEAHVLPRSSTFEKWGILCANSQGVIDNSYCGDNDIWQFPAIAMRATHIEKGDRICQFRIVKKQPKIYFEAVESLNNADRGGFGSTGVK